MTTTTTDQSPTSRSAAVEALGILGSGPEERFDRITRMTQQAFGVPLSFLNLVHHDVVTAQSAQGWEQGGDVPADQVFCSVTVMQDGPVVVPDARLDPRFRDMAAVRDQGIRFYAGAPLAMADGTQVGTLCIMDAEPRELSAADVELLADLARWAERELGHVLDRDRVRRVLASMTPEPVSLPGLDLQVVSSARETSGDVADWRTAADGTLRLTVGSVSAVGRAAALLASTIRAAVVARTDLELGSDGPALETQIGDDLTASNAVGSLFHARVEPDSGRLVYVDAGHGLALHVRADGTRDVLGTTDLPIGLQRGTGRTHVALTLEPGDRLVVVTRGTFALDGLPDIDAVASLAVAAGADLPDRVRALLPTAPDDDVTVVVLTRRPVG
ncbi:PP2C family protein-serine/threonine phosphatase [Curtobacterium sp. VKM Ac-2922]|uniref:PP2C family protein-serine/threonine phosphatase n=1 Tax=Curtobacterium sp. VKM Ac-2922 TaxID=2929475 RepID=UPI001FB2B294|nr:GAF domain-containing SpoIIE family protein phosphatase [Curtobacterium sp. VKM Ac-2922]MCJ1715275.1 SpoIIE family protein phosphatase [Curtobacterium sp. VKM Ac-2922]